MNCPNCQKEIMPDSYFCTWCSDFIPASGQGKRANLFSRWFAWAADPLIAIALYAFSLAVLLNIWRPLAFLGAFVLPAVYFAWFLQLLRQGLTPGKKLVSLQVVDTQTGRIPGFGKMFLREIVGRFVSGLVFRLGYFWAVFDKNAQAWHDKIAGTVVLQRPVTRSPVLMGALGVAGSGLLLLLSVIGAAWSLGRWAAAKQAETGAAVAQAAFGAGLSKTQTAPVNSSPPTEPASVERVGFSFRVRNESPERLTLHWIGADAQPVVYGTLGPYEERQQPSTVGHVWYVENGDGTKYRYVVSSEQPVWTVPHLRDHPDLAPSGFDAFSSYAGTWSGTVSQPGYGTYPATLHVARGESFDAGSIDYPSLPCRHTLVDEAFTRHALVLREHLQFGNCTSGDRLVLLARMDGGLLAQWYTAEGVFQAEGTLERAMPPEDPSPQPEAGARTEPSSGSAPVPFVGSWVGSLEQNGSHAVRMRIHNTVPGQPAGRADYPTLGCSHSLVLEESAASGFKVRQILKSGPCVTNNIVEFRFDQPDVLSATWYWPDGRLGATGRLNRERP